VPARIAIVGEAPGRNEERQGRPFIGPSGHVMWEMLGPIVGLRREDVWITNAWCCRPEKVELETGAIIPKDTVMKLAQQCCLRRLISELRIVDPVVIIPLGKWALTSITGLFNAKIYSYRGSRMEIDLESRYREL